MKLSGALFRLVLVAVLFGFLFGLDIGNMSGALPFIERVFTLDAETKGLLSGSIPLGAVGGVVLAAFISDTMGRRRVLLACAAIFLAASVLCAFAGNIETLVFARLLIGVAIGASSMTAPMLLAELAPTAIRGAVVGSYQLMITIGITCAYLIDLALSGSQEWRWMLGLAAVPALLACAGVLTSPDSPRWLILRGRAGEARDVLARLYPDRSPADIASEVETLGGRLDDTPAALPWATLAAPKVRRIVVFCMMMSLLQQLSGINAVLYYTPDIMAAAGMSDISAQLIATVGVGSLNVVMTIVSMLLIDRIGRRPLLLIGFAGTAASLTLVAITIVTPGETDSVLAVVSLMVYILFYSIALGPLPWIYMAELFPMRLKTRGMALATATNWTMNFAVVFLFPVISTAMGIATTFALFSGFCVFGLIYAHRHAPETKGRPLEDTEELLA